MYNVNSIQFGNSIKIDYEISGEESTLRNVTSKDDMVHQEQLKGNGRLKDKRLIKNSISIKTAG